MSSSRGHLLRRGVDAPPPAREALRAGPLSVGLEGADLRSIRLGEAEVVRHLYVAVRDRNWDTIPATISDRSVASDARSFAASFLAEHRLGEIDFAWRGTIRGEADGTITYRMEGEARSTFLRNRIGFCLLHPILGVAGRPCRVETVGGETVDGRFPERISPRQPFKGIRAISHEVGRGTWAEVRFEGETFEMEDQRNWTDGSFKTYGTPLDLPFPVEVAAGTRIEQAVTIRLIEPEAGRLATVSVFTEPARPLPPIGLGLGDPSRAMSPREADRLGALNLGHLRVDLDLTRPDAADVLARAHERAGMIGGVPLEVAAFVSDAADEELAALARAVGSIRPRVARWMIFHFAEKATSERWVRLAREHLGPATPGVPIGAGSNAYFTEVNRGYPPVPPIDFVCYSINPQVHAFDDASIVETFEAQPQTVASAQALTGGLPVVVSPITLRPRFNPNATAAEPEPAPGELPSQVDPRQMSLFGAGWTLGTLAALLGDGLEVPPAALTFYEAVGWRGVLESETGPPLPDRFPSRPGEAFPMYHVFADVGEFAGGSLLPVHSFEPLGVAALALTDGSRMRVLAANLTGEPRVVTVFGLGPVAAVRLLDEMTAEQAMASPESFRAERGAEAATNSGSLTIELRPYALARIDSELPGPSEEDA